MLIEHSRNSHSWSVETTKRHTNIKVALLSDLHWDNPKCDRDLLKKHLDYCLENNIRVLLNGDTFCLMQGKYDPRKSKQSIRPEHNVANYLDAVIESAVEWFTPYAEIIDVVGYGNHETNIIKRQETDPLQRFVDLLNFTAKPESKIYTGGYGGWYVIRSKNGGTRQSYVVRYFHGSGGGGVVTRGEINLSRALQMYEGFDCFTMGHVHENKETTVRRNRLNINTKVGEEKDLLLCITGTYKEEYDDGYMGWHVERGAPPKPIGGRILDVNFRTYSHKENELTAISYKL